MITKMMSLPARMTNLATSSPGPYTRDYTDSAWTTTTDK